MEIIDLPPEILFDVAGRLPLEDVYFLRYVAVAFHFPSLDAFRALLRDDDGDFLVWAE
jgi:hypothetical protein